MVYGRYNELVHGVFKPTNITGGHHPVWVYWVYYFRNIWGLHMLFFVVIPVFNQLFMGFLLWSLTYQHQVNPIKDPSTWGYTCDIIGINQHV